MSLYLKYRPKTIAELDLTKVRERLTQIVKSNRLAQAYLFVGPRGTGKTSTARILARVANCEQNRKELGEPCNQCEACRSILEARAVDVWELDAASNRRIDDVRELKEKIKLAPTSLLKKVYIIDEVHMLTHEAFNALLKTLEEPPEHTLFILCTTEAHKVPETIASRCVEVKFEQAKEEEVLRALGRVVKGEEMEIKKEALALIARKTGGSFRDAVKILGELAGRKGEVRIEAVEEILSGVSGWSIAELTKLLAEKEKAALGEYQRLVKMGVELSYLLVELMKQLRDLVVIKGRREFIPLIWRLDEAGKGIASSPVPEILPEMVIVEWCDKVSDSGGQDKLEEEQAVVREHDKDKDVKQVWEKMVQSLNGDSYSLQALLSKAEPGMLVDGELTIGVRYEFHREQLMQEKQRRKLEALVSKLVGQPTRIKCEVLKKDQEIDKIEAALPEEEILVEEAKQIFIN